MHICVSRGRYHHTIAPVSGTIIFCLSVSEVTLKAMVKINHTNRINNETKQNKIVYLMVVILNPENFHDANFVVAGVCRYDRRLPPGTTKLASGQLLDFSWHYRAITWTSRPLKSQATRLFVQFSLTTKKSSKVRITVFCEGNPSIKRWFIPTKGQ